MLLVYSTRLYGGEWVGGGFINTESFGIDRTV